MSDDRCACATSAETNADSASSCAHHQIIRVPRGEPGVVDDVGTVTVAVGINVTDVTGLDSSRYTTHNGVNVIIAQKNDVPLSSKMMYVAEIAREAVLDLLDGGKALSIQHVSFMGNNHAINFAHVYNKKLIEFAPDGTAPMDTGDDTDRDIFSVVATIH